MDSNSCLPHIPLAISLLISGVHVYILKTRRKRRTLNCCIVIFPVVFAFKNKCVFVSYVVNVSASERRQRKEKIEVTKVRMN